MVKQPGDDEVSKKRLTEGTRNDLGSKESVTGDDTEADGSYGRRSYLKFAGMATAGSVLATLQTSAASTEMPHAIVFDGRETSTPTEYSFAVSDAVDRVTGIDNTADSLDGSAVQGTVNGTMNAYLFSGSIERFYVSGPADVRFGSDLDELVPGRQRSIKINADSRITYRFTTSGEISKTSTADGSEIETDHTLIVQNDDDTWTAFGCTGDDYEDTFHFKGDIVDFCPLEGDHTVTLDGTEMTPYEVVGQEPPQSSDDQQSDDQQDTSGSVDPSDYLGGGAGYPNVVSESTADYTVASESELRSAFSNASSGDVVYVTGDISITDTRTIPSGVTVAGDRGIDGSEGARVYTTRDSFPVLKASGGVRITGLTIEGPVEEYEVRQGYPVSTGVRVAGPNVEVDNCRLRGFSHAGVQVQGYDTHVHHCDIRRNARDGLGYGVVIGGGHPTIEHCTFNYNRHSVATSSGSGGFTIDNCHFGPDAMGLVIDHHGPDSGSEMYVRNSTVEATRKLQHPDFDRGGREETAIGIRGSTAPGRLHVENCWFYDPEPSPVGDFGDAINFAQSASSWSAVNTTIQNCHFGETEPDASVGHPR